MYRRSFRRPKKSYQIVRPGFNITVYGTPTGAQRNWTTIVDPADVTGVRKVKNFKITFNTSYGNAGSPPSFYFALVYVPKGYSPNEVFPQGVNDLYSPANNVILCGFLDTSDPAQQTWFSPLSRNLNAGDGLALVYKNLDPSKNTPSQVLIQYAITF